MARTYFTVRDTCPACGAVLVLRYSPKQDMRFIGCSAWSRDGKGCSYTSGYDEAIQELGDLVRFLEHEVTKLKATAQQVQAKRRKDMLQ